MLRLYYSLTTGEIAHAVLGDELVRVRPDVGLGLATVDDDVPANWPAIRLLLRSLAPPPRPRPDAPPPPRAWRIRLADKAILRSNGSVWTPEINAERQGLFDPLPGGQGIVTFLDAVIADVTATPREKQFARILRRLVRRLRQRDAGTTGD